MCEYRILEVITPCRLNGESTEVKSYKVQKMWLGICFRTMRTPQGGYITVHEYNDYDSAKEFLDEYIARNNLNKPRRGKATFFDKYGKEMKNFSSHTTNSGISEINDDK